MGPFYRISCGRALKSQLANEDRPPGLFSNCFSKRQHKGALALYWFMTYAPVACEFERSGIPSERFHKDVDDA